MKRLDNGLKPGNVVPVDLKAGIEEISEKMKENLERIGTMLEEKEGMTKMLSEVIESMIERNSEVETLWWQGEEDRNRIQEEEKLRVRGIDDEIGLAQRLSELHRKVEIDKEKRPDLDDLLEELDKMPIAMFAAV
jgi:3-methyladenine DNA glycosylase AlkD